MNIAADLETLETGLLLEAIFRRFGKDFRHHNTLAVRAKLRRFMADYSIPNLSALQERILHDPRYVDPLLRTLENPLPKLFGHPERLLAMRAVLVPWLRSCPAPKVWIAEAVTAEQVFWLPILLQEEGLLARTQVYITAADSRRLAEAKRGRFSAELFAHYDENYRSAGGLGSLADFCVRIDDHFIFNAELHQHLTWAEYHLGRDASLNEFEAIFCCADLSGFSLDLCRNTHDVFYESQPTFGLLTILNENFVATPAIPHYRALYNAFGVYQRV